MATVEHASELLPIREKVLAGERLDLDDGIALLESDDLLGLGELADTARRLRGGSDEVFFVNNLYLNHTTICRVKCKFCAFAKTSRQPGAMLWDIDDLVEHAVTLRRTQDFTEIHMVGGENPHLDLAYYVDVTRALRQALPDVHLKLFTASEIHHMTKLSGLEHEEVLRELVAAGLDTLPGGGAEIFAPRVRKIIAPARSPPSSGSGPIGRRTTSASAPTARCSTTTWRRTRSASTTCSGCGSCRTRRAASWPSSRCRSTRRTPSSSAGAGPSPPARTTSR
jgi:2-iminoacetate synthase ThiH